MAASVTDYFKKVGSPGSATSLSAPGHTIGGDTFNVDSTSLWPTDTGVTFAIDTVTIVNGVEVRDTGSYTVWDGVVTSATSIGSAVLRYGTDQNYPAGSTTRVYIIPNTTQMNKLIDGILEEHKQDGTHGDITPTSVVSSGPITGTVGTFSSVVVTGTATSQGWTALGATPATVTANSTVPNVYSLVFSGTDLTGTLSDGMKLQATRTVAAPNQSTSLNGTNQYYSKTSPNKMTFTDTFTVSAWIKLTSYNGAINAIASRYNGTSGWRLYLEATGQLVIAGYNASSTNNRFMTSYASVPLNRWVHVAASFSMSDHTTSTCKMMFDGIDVGGTIGSGGTNPTALIQAGNLEIGASNGGTSPFNGKLAQVAVYSAVITPATILAAKDRTLSGSETNLASAYSFNGVITDLNTTTPNDLTANNSAAATNADSPFGNNGASTTLEYAEVLARSFSTDTTVTVRVPVGCQLPTSGGISSVLYSTQSNPYGLPMFEGILGSVARMSAQTGVTTEVDLAGMAFPIYVPSGRKVRLSFAAVASGSAGRRLSVRIKEGSTTYQEVISGDLADSMSVVDFVDIYPTPGVHTYKTTVLGRGGVSISIDASTTFPATLVAEVV